MVWHEPFQILNPWQTIQNLSAGFFMAKLVQWSFPSLVHQVRQVHQVNLTDSEWKRPDDNQRTGSKLAPFGFQVNGVNGSKSM